MAEERIILTIDDGYCREKCSCFPIACSAECEHLNKPTFSYTRQEAVERMAKGIARQYDPDRPNAKEYERIWDEELLDRVKQSFRKKAEAALNALLEVEKC